MKGTPTKTNRNKNLVRDKEKMTFEQLAKKYKMSATRAKQIYYREIKRSKKNKIKIKK